MTVNGKIDRRGLPEVDLSAEDHYVAARGAMEELLVSIWSDVLKLSPDRISVTRSFFDLGGHSLKAMNLVNRIRKETGSEVALKTIFSHQDIRSLSLHMSGLSGGPAYSAILPAVDKPHYVLSSAQKRLYFLYEFDRSSLAYNMPQAVWLKGEVDRARLLRSFEQLVGRHEILRTSFVLLGDEPFQVIGDGSGFTVTEYDADEEGVSVVMSGFVRPFDLSRGPLIRVGLVNVSPGLTLLMVDMHHIISDGVSHGILIGDFMSFYSGEDPGPVGLQYKDYAEWQQGAAEQERMLGQKSFWLSEYGELPLALELPLDYPRTKGASHPGGSYGLELDEATTSSLRRLGEEEGATLFMVLLSVYTVFLGRLCNSDDVVVGTPVAGRGHADLDGVMGVFINMLALRNRPRGDLSFRAFLKEVRSHALSCFEHQDFQYEDLVDELNLPRDTGRTPLFDATFSYQNFDGSSLSIPGLELLPYGQGSGISKFDLSLFASEDSGGLQLSLVYSTGLFSASTVRGFGTYLEQLFRSVAAGPGLSLGELNLLPAGERSALLELGKGAGFVYGREKTVVDLFCEQARQHADSVAVVYEGGVLRYGELDGLSNQLASLLRDTYGIRPGDTVGISVGGSELLLVGILGILKAGGVYVPFDVDYPADRKSYLCSDAGIRLLLSVTDHVFDAVDYYGGAIMALDAELDCDALGYSRPVVPLTGNSLAYISYTSGSTGSPKGVMVPHQGILRLLHLSDIELGEPTVTLQLSPVSFDAATFEIWAALLSGGKVVMKGDGLIDLSGLHGLIESHGVNTLWLTSGLLDQWCEGDLSGLPLRYVLSGGDVVRAASVAKVYRQLPGVCVYNGYGPTENTTFTCMYAIPRGIADQSHIPIGRPVMGTDVYVLGRSGGLSPLGVSGELCVSGFGLAQGYVGNDALTREKFVANPFEENSLMYRTGDLVRWGDDGNLEFLGRMDSQVKIRGYRIEPGEIEVVMGGLDGINQVLVEVVGDGPEKALVAYYTTLSGLAVEDLKERVKELLPDYMLPSYYVHLASFPLTLNGKIDRRKLPVVELSGESDYHAPSGEMEELLVSVWSEV
ncbi:amino acid adenylation domain-containing protein, partial [Pedobacter suwonensis]